MKTRRPKTRLLGVLALALSAGALPSRAETVTFQQGVSGYTGTVDTYLHAGLPNADNGAVITLVVDGVPAAADERQLLMRFDTLFASVGGPIPDGATIDSAILTVRITNPSADGAELHRMLVPWSAASTWNSLGAGVQRNGVESMATADVTSLYNGTVPSLHSMDVTASVAAWSAGASNLGWAWVTPAGGTDSWQITSAQATTAGNRPKLTVQYHLPFVCSIDADCADGDACNGTETCVAGACQGGTPLLCDDGIACTTDSCLPLSGCQHADVCPPGQSCNAATGTCRGGFPATATFQQAVGGYTGTVDTYLHAGLPDANNGVAATLVVDGIPAAEDERQVLLRFDALFASSGGPIPDGSPIISASLDLRVTDPSADGAELHRMLASWSAGATWNGLGGGIQRDGIDSVGTADVSSFYSGAVPSVHTIDVTGSLAAWSAGATNLGWVFVTPAGGADAWQFDSAEGTTPPQLTVTYRDDNGPQGRLSCALSSASAPPSGSVELIVLLENAGGLEGIRGYQTQIAVTRTSGTGTVGVPCPGGVDVDESRPDYLFSGQADTYPVTNCALGRTSSSLLSGSVTAPASAYLSRYTLDVLPDSTPGSTFEIAVTAYPDSALANTNADPVAFASGLPCVLTVAQGACLSGADCDDADVCNGAEACTDGACIPGAPLVCGDGNACTDDTCDPASGCVFTNNTAPCDDGIACTADACSGGACVGTSACPSGEVCDLGTGSCATPVTLGFQNGAGYEGTQDSYLAEDNPESKKGTVGNWKWDLADPTGSAFGLIRFDDLVGTGPGQIPPGSTVQSATLTLVVSDQSAAPAGEVHESMASWVEASVTWNNFGGEAGVQADEIGALVATAPVSMGTATLDVTSSLQKWVADPSANLGFIFVPRSNNGAAVRSSEYTTTLTDRPKLTVTFLP